ncbi:MAG: type II toxin-antitoxin system HicA family toxin [Deltaproteobacteria bacterium]
MSIEHINLLHSELPELFQDRDLAPDWYDNLIIVGVTDPEKVTTDKEELFPADVPTLSPRQEDLFNRGEELLDGDALDAIGPDLIDQNAPFPDLAPIIVQVLGGSHAGAPLPYTHQPKMPPPDCLAFYLPFHYYHPDWWGIYILFEGVVWLAEKIMELSENTVSRQQAFEASRLFLYYHEAFHHKTESFSTRLELTHRRAFFKTGFERYYQKTFGTVGCLEEGLANATALLDCWKKLPYKNIDRSLSLYVDQSPPGYDQGNVFRPQFVKVRCDFAEGNQRISLPQLPAKNPEIWRTSPHLFHGISNIKSRVNYVIPRSSAIAQRLRLRPCLPPKKVIAKLRQLVGLELIREGGRHQVWRTSDGKIVEIPRHPGDLGRGLLRQILRQSGLDIGLEEFLSV